MRGNKPVLSEKILSLLEQEPQCQYEIAQKVATQRDAIGVLIRRFRYNLLVKMVRMEEPRRGANPRQILTLTPLGKKKLEEIRKVLNVQPKE